MRPLLLFVILLAQLAPLAPLGQMPAPRPYAPQGMPGMVPLNRIVPQMGNPWPRGSVGNPVYAVPAPPPPGAVAVPHYETIPPTYTWGNGVPQNQPNRPAFSGFDDDDD